MGRPNGKRPIERHRCGWERIKKYILKLQWGAIVWSDLAEDRDRWRTLVNMVMNL
jgi:hypothetical protein